MIKPKQQQEKQDKEKQDKNRTQSYEDKNDNAANKIYITIDEPTFDSSNMGIKHMKEKLSIKERIQVYSQ